MKTYIKATVILIAIMSASSGFAQTVTGSQNTTVDSIDSLNLGNNNLIGIGISNNNSNAAKSGSQSTAKSGAAAGAVASGQGGSNQKPPSGPPPKQKPSDDHSPTPNKPPVTPTADANASAGVKNTVTDTSSSTANANNKNDVITTVSGTTTSTNNLSNTTTVGNTSNVTVSPTTNMTVSPTSTVTGSGNSNVKNSGNSTVKDSGNSTVKDSGNANLSNVGNSTSNAQTGPVSVSNENQGNNVQITYKQAAAGAASMYATMCTSGTGLQFFRAGMSHAKVEYYCKLLKMAESEFATMETAWNMASVQIDGYIETRNARIDANEEEINRIEHLITKDSEGKNMTGEIDLIALKAKMQRLRARDEQYQTEADVAYQNALAMNTDVKKHYLAGQDYLEKAGIRIRHTRITSFIAEVSGDLLTPLTAIYGVTH